MFIRSRAATVGAILYWLAFVCASVYPEFDSRTFAGLPAVMLAWPWIDYIPHPSPWPLLTGCALLNTILIYVFIAALSLVWDRFRKRKA
jgi:hypothetical protein